MQANFSDDGIDEDDEPSKATQSKRRKRSKQRPGKKFSDNVPCDDNASDDDGTLAKGKGKAACRLGYYTGTTLDLLKQSIIFMRLYLLTCNGFPSVKKLLKNAKKFYKVACQMKFGPSWKSTFQTKLILYFCLFYLHCVLAGKMPQFTNEMSRLVCKLLTCVALVLTCS